MNNISDLFGKIQEVQDNMKRVREQMNEIVVEADAGGGMVRVKANANKRIIKVTIDPDVVSDIEMLEDLVCAAANKALEKAEERGKEEMGKITQNLSGMLPPLPGLDLSKLGL